MSELAFAPIFGDGMVLQRQKELTVWGTSGCEGTVHVFLGNLRSEAAVKDGRWICTFPPMDAACGMTLLAKQGAAAICIRNVMIGDVWLAGGQSNMEFFLRYENHWEEAQKLPKNDLIRMYTCPRVAYDGQIPYQNEVGYWFGEGDRPWETFAAAAYWFARELQPKLGVPIGIVSCNWGGTSASAWMPKDSLIRRPLNVYADDYEAAISDINPEENYAQSMRGWALQLDQDHLRDWARVMYGIDREAQLERLVCCAKNPVVPMGPYHKNRPGCLFEHMILPVSNFAIKGILWYQGENDAHHAPLYSKLFSELIAEWRKLWGEDIPFLFAQLAPFERWMALDGDRFPEIRRQQEMVSRTVKNCWMIATSDVGMRYDIHPKEKRALGHRFCLRALDKVYGLECLSDTPEMVEGTVYGNRIQLRFACTGEGLRAEGEIRQLFCVRQNGMQLTVEDVAVCGDSVFLTAELDEDVSAEVSFAEQPYYEVTLYNSAGIPAKPFSAMVSRRKV